VVPGRPPSKVRRLYEALVAHPGIPVDALAARAGLPRRSAQSIMSRWLAAGYAWTPDPLPAPPQPGVPRVPPRRYYATPLGELPGYARRAIRKGVCSAPRSKFL
jgi:hypothetical protein